MSTQLFYDIFPSPIGNLLLIAQEFSLIKITFQTKNKAHKIYPEWILNSKLIKQTKQELKSYFDGQLKIFTIKLNPEGTPFQKQIWKELKSIPHGQIYSYQDIAKKIDNPTACRAVGRANSLNPIPIIIPCHRVIGKNGNLTGYSGGLYRKQQLLSLEGINTEIHPKQNNLL